MHSAVQIAVLSAILAVDHSGTAAATQHEDHSGTAAATRSISKNTHSFVKATAMAPPRRSNGMDDHSGAADYIVSSAPSQEVVSCSAFEHREMPCQCCKKDCWYTIASAATHELGHMPGEAGEQEAMATLRLIRACMMSECADLCLARRPF